MIRACIKLEPGIHSLRNLFWLVKDTFLSKLSVTIQLIQHGACLKKFTSIRGSTTEATLS